MKISMGPYLNWWGSYQLLHLLTYLGVEEETVGKWAAKSPEWLDEILSRIYHKRSRPIKIKIDEYDIWSMDSTLSLIIVPMLRLLKEKKHSIPWLDVMDQTSNVLQNSFPFYAEGDSEVIEAGRKEWDLILDKMIWSFEQVSIGNIYEKYTVEDSSHFDLEKVMRHENKIKELESQGRVKT